MSLSGNSGVYCEVVLGADVVAFRSENKRNHNHVLLATDRTDIPKGHFSKRLLFRKVSIPNSHFF